ncbi:MAG: hypothetical protein Q8L48_27690 [Archangium sp.]|nr:hypothetical protein [Archangium sp.]
MKSPDEHEDLESLLGAARRDLPPLDTDRVAAVALTTPLAAPPLWRSLFPKLALAAVVISVGVIAWRQFSASSSTAPEQVRPAVVLVPSPAPIPVALEPEPIAEAEPLPLPAPHRPAARARAPELAPTPPPTASELELQEGAVLLRARRALSRGEPERALLACEEHAQAFQSGKLAPEREAIAIDALNALGRVEQAQSRAQRFIARWPESAYADRARRALAR